MSQFTEGTLWDLAGPAGGTWYALVFSDEHASPSKVPEVIVVPARAGVNPWDDIAHDIVCPAAASPTGEALVFAAWAIAPMPSHCLKREIGRVSPVIVARVKKCLATDKGRAEHRRRSQIGEPSWHGELRDSLTGYWDGSVMISCATMPAAAVDAA